MSAQRSGSGPGSGPPRRDIRRFTEIDSTNRYLADLAAGDARHGLVAVADHQTAGRGRLGRRWEAPPGANLLMSVLLRPTFSMEWFHLCGAVVGLAAVTACRQAGVDDDLGLKWPNDLVVGDRKLGGILVEIVAPAPGSSSPAVVVGLGLNVGWPAPDDAGEEPVPGEIEAIATSLWRETGHRPAPGDVLEDVLDDLDQRLGDLADPAGRQRQWEQYRARCATVGRQVLVTLTDEELTGTAVDITPQGHLVIDVGSSLETVTAGDVVHLRGVSD
jgi:BirA family transcriptional regulator, biotin operon repressor / biotin---[acetyl-CoA-carboxylase] ligase